MEENAESNNEEARKRSGETIWVTLGYPSTLAPQISAALKKVSEDTDINGKYRRVFKKQMPVLRAAWKNSGYHHEMRIRATVRKREATYEQI